MQLRRFAGLSLLFILSSASACGGTTRFSGNQAFAISGTAPTAVPEAGPAPRVELRDDKIELKEKIQFEVNRAKIKPESYALLHEIADVIKKNAQLKRISIEGHASAEGAAGRNLKLSRDRARAVRKHLVNKESVPAAELEIQAWGEDKPIADNNTPDGREANRRVEFLVVEQDVTVKKVEIDPKTGTERVVEEKKDTLKADAARANPGAKAP